MEEQRLIQVSVQLPVSELGRLSALLERFQQVLASSGQTEPALSQSETTLLAEQGENTAFDPARFSALRESSGLQEGSVQAQAEPEQAKALPNSGQTEPPQTASLRAEAEAGIPLPASAARGMERQLPEATGAQSPAGQEAAREEDQARSSAPNRLPDALAVQAAAGNGGGDPLSAGFTVEADTGIPGSGEKGAIEERLVMAGPAPLTAEAVSLAFRRDDRRYDNGFPLY